MAVRTSEDLEIAASAISTTTKGFGKHVVQYHCWRLDMSHGHWLVASLSAHAPQDLQSLEHKRICSRQ